MKHIIEIVKDHGKSGLLYPINHPFKAAKRRIWVTAEIYKILYEGPWENEEQEDEWQKTKAHVEQIAAGDPLVLGNHRSCRMAPMVKPPYKPHWDVWDIRTKKRILGQFIEPDFFIGLTYAGREEFNTKRDWEKIIRQTRAEWRNLFQPYTAYKKEGDHESYISKSKRFKRSE